MEKYTIDIDKVLDEFEETEALKVHAEKKPDFAFDQPRTANGLSSSEAAFSSHSMNKNVLDSSICAANNTQDSDPSLKKDILQLSNDGISSNSYILECERNFLCNNVISENLNKNDTLCNDSAPSKHLKYDIFYKSHESSSFKDKSNNHSVSDDHLSEDVEHQYNLCDSSPEEILCVSVQEDETKTESQSIRSQSLVSENVIISKDFSSIDSIMAAEISSQPKVFSLVVNDPVLGSKDSEFKCEPKCIEKLDVSSLTELKITPGSSVSKDISTLQSDHSNKDSSSEGTVHEISATAEPNALNPSHEFLSHSSSDDLAFKAVLDSVPCNIEKQVLDSPNEPSCNDSLNESVKCDNVYKTEDMEAQHTHDEIDTQVNESLEDKFIAGQDVENVHVDEINLGNFSIQDDDSGVSSTEDISGNSPIEISNSESNKSVPNENCDPEDKFSCVESSDNLAFHLDVSDQADNSTGLVIGNKSLQNEEKQNGMSLHDEKSSSDIKSTVDHCVFASNSFAGARPKLDQSNTDVLTHASDTEVNVVEVNENISINRSDLDINESVSSKQLEIQPEKLVPEYENHSSVDIKEVIVNDSVRSNEVVDSEYSNECVENESISASNEVVNGEDCTNLLEDPKDDFSPRLQRPTTLDLPSLQIASPDIPENVSATDDASAPDISDEPLMDVSPDVSLQQNIAEYIPCAKQPQIGLVKPYWIPDAEAPNCMHCGMKFTVLKRRHHCRGCGKVLCSRCCNQKAYLPYLNKEDRICQPCSDILATTLQSDQMSVPFDTQSSSSCGSSPNFSPTPQVPSSNFGDKNSWRPHPNNPDDYCSTIPPLQQIQSSGQRPPPTVMVPIGVLKRGNKPRREPKQVIFSDGIRPGGDLTDLTEPVETVPVYRRIGRKRVDKIVSGDSKHGSVLSPSTSLHPRSKHKRTIISDGEGQLPPVLFQIDNENDEKIEWHHVFERIKDDDQKAVSFALMKNMHLFVKLTKLDCCFGNECWCFTSCGLSTVGQDEVMVILKRLPGETDIPRDIFKLFSQIYDSASKGSTFDDLGHIIFPEQILGSSDHRGFLFVRPTFQCLSKLTVPNTPYLVAILIHKWEVPWAKVFPLRLMLRLGAECRYYPCALVSIRNRKPVYFEIGQTIMSVLADLRNYQFTIPVIPGLVVHMEEKKTCVNIPRNRYEKVIKVLNCNNVEHVLALGSNFSTEADSHLVCMQKEEGDYQTQAINIENTTRRVTGASFIVFSGALKSTSGLSAKFSIVEDGLLIQIPQETMVALHMALRDMRDLTIECGQINAAEPEEIVIIQWTRDDKKFNIGVRSPIDSKSFEGVPNLRIHTSTDYAGDNYLIRWTEVFFLDVDENGSSIQNELVDPCRLAETVAQSCCMALTPYLDQLAEAELIKLGLRVTLDSQRDRVEYDVGARGKALPALYMNALDSGLIPVLLRLSGSTQSEKLSFELIFHILIK